MHYSLLKNSTDFLQKRLGKGSSSLLLHWNSASIPNQRATGGASRPKDGAAVVLLTGFGSFTQDENGQPKENITQVLLNSLAGSPAPESAPWGEEIDLHLAVSPTDWLAPVRFHQLATTLAPDLIVNLGQGETCLETGALNLIGQKRDEYDGQGKLLVGPKLVGDRMCDEAEVPMDIELSWSRHVRAHRQAIFADLPFNHDIIADRARPENTYICNATAWCLGATVAGYPLDLFNGLIRLEPLPSRTLHGFLHLSPQEKSNGESMLPQYLMLIKNLVRSMVG